MKYLCAYIVLFASLTTKASPQPTENEMNLKIRVWTKDCVFYPNVIDCFRQRILFPEQTVSIELYEDSEGLSGRWDFDFTLNKTDFVAQISIEKPRGAPLYSVFCSIYSTKGWYGDTASTRLFVEDLKKLNPLHLNGPSVLKSNGKGAFIPFFAISP